MVELSEEEHIALSLKVSMDSIWEEQAAWVVSFIMTKPRVLLPVLFSLFYILTLFFHQALSF